jgi:hypothetical protein
LIDGILLPKKDDPVGLLHFLYTPCLSIIIYFDESKGYNYINIILKKGLGTGNIGIPLKIIDQDTTKKIINRFSKKSSNQH